MISLGLLLILLQMGSIDAQAPETPTNVILTQLSENILQLKWSAPQADDPLVTNYILTLTDEAGTEKNYLISGDAESYTINNLVPLVPYTIAFSALNDDGASNDAQAQITLVKGPNPPTNVYLKPKSANLYNLVWDAPVGPYDHLLLRYGPADDLEDFQEFEIEKNQTSYDMKNLTQNVRYAVQFYSLKNGVSSVAATIALDSGQRPDPPTAVNVQSFGTTVDLTWSGPDGEVDGYAVAYYPTDGSEDPVTVYFDEDETSATISDLKESQDYTFNVYSVKNKVPSPGVGVQVTIPSPADRPSPPGFLDYVRTSSTGYKIFWEENLNSDVDSFLLQYRPVDGSVGVQEISVPATEVGVTLEDLQADVGYEFSIFSVADNVLSEPVTVDSAPEPPHELSFESITETSLNVFWLPSDDLSVDSYYLKYSEVNANTEAVSVTAPSTARNVLIEDIVPGSEYELSLSSVSEGIKSQPLTLLTGNLPDPCFSQPCKNMGFCFVDKSSGSPSFYCFCLNGFSGSDCGIGRSQHAPINC
ncbi:fibronectin-like isoform X1 [Anneissia japonica]|uniref:fibronectin-like isoform X1 n=1 Tax=Anneissia japonica TaxID=1529436 RepID=UPI0014258B5A|nr:fibronectin-like isoform X1 [Anneissia japonica]